MELHDARRPDRIWKDDSWRRRDGGGFNDHHARLAGKRRCPRSFYCYDTTDDGNCSGGWLRAGMGTTVSVSGLAPATTYYWQAMARNPGGPTYANGGTWWSFTTQVAEPGAFGKLGPANGWTGQGTSPTLSWAASSGATSYRTCIDTTNNGSCAPWTSVGTNTSVTLSGLDPWTPHYWQVRASMRPGRRWPTSAGGGASAACG